MLPHGLKNMTGVFGSYVPPISTTCFIQFLPTATTWLLVFEVSAFKHSSAIFIFYKICRYQLIVIQYEYILFAMLFQIQIQNIGRLNIKQYALIYIYKMFRNRSQILQNTMPHNMPTTKTITYSHKLLNPPLNPSSPSHPTLLPTTPNLSYTPSPTYTSYQHTPTPYNYHSHLQIKQNIGQPVKEAYRIQKTYKTYKIQNMQNMQNMMIVTPVIGTVDRMQRNVLADKQRDSGKYPVTMQSTCKHVQVQMEANQYQGYSDYIEDGNIKGKVCSIKDIVSHHNNYYYYDCSQPSSPTNNITNNRNNNIDNNNINNNNINNNVKNIKNTKNKEDLKAIVKQKLASKKKKHYTTLSQLHTYNKPSYEVNAYPHSYALSQITEKQIQWNHHNASIKARRNNCGSRISYINNNRNMGANTQGDKYDDNWNRKKVVDDSKQMQDVKCQLSLLGIDNITESFEVYEEDMDHINMDLLTKKTTNTLLTDMPCIIQQQCQSQKQIKYMLGQQQKMVVLQQSLILPVSSQLQLQLQHKLTNYSSNKNSDYSSQKNSDYSSQNNSEYSSHKNNEYSSQKNSEYSSQKNSENQATIQSHNSRSQAQYHPVQQSIINLSSTTQILQYLISHKNQIHNNINNQGIIVIARYVVNQYIQHVGTHDSCSSSICNPYMKIQQRYSNMWNLAAIVYLLYTQHNNNNSDNNNNNSNNRQVKDGILYRTEACCPYKFKTTHNISSNTHNNSNNNNNIFEQMLMFVQHHHNNINNIRIDGDMIVDLIVEVVGLLMNTTMNNLMQHSQTIVQQICNHRIFKQQQQA